MLEFSYRNLIVNWSEIEMLAELTDNSEGDGEELIIEGGCIGSSVTKQLCSGPGVL